MINLKEKAEVKNGAGNVQSWSRENAHLEKTVDGGGPLVGALAHT